MITFYPGPSKLDERLPQWFQEGVENGYISANHRSDFFMQQYGEICDLLKEVFHVPDEYSIYFVSSATECWEIIGQSFNQLSFAHLYNGAFGRKWASTNSALKNHVKEYSYDFKDIPNAAPIKDADAICLTHNETSNGTKLPDNFIQEMRDGNPQSLIFVDATSSMGGVMLPWLAADIWYASLQKCFGLPAGMALLICSPEAIDRANNGPHYNQIANLQRNYELRQTTHTPNTLNIFFLWRMLQDHQGLQLISEKIRTRAWHLYNGFKEFQNMEVLIKDKEIRSDTVLSISILPELLDSLFEFMDAKEIVLGKGYSELKSGTFRIANFPAIKRREYDSLFHNIREWQDKL